VLFKPFTASYKNFKEKFFKVYVEPAGTRYFFDEVDQPRFPLFWSRSPSKITDCPRLAYPSEHERLIFSLFDILPRKLPARPLMSLYNAIDRDEAFEGMSFKACLVLFIAFCFDRPFLVLLAEIAKREIPQAVAMLHSFKNKLNEKRGAAGAKPRVEEGSRWGPSKKRGREGAILPAPCRRRDRCPLHLQLDRLDPLLRQPMNLTVLFQRGWQLPWLPRAVQRLRWWGVIGPSHGP